MGAILRSTALTTRRPFCATRGSVLSSRKKIAANIFNLGRAEIEYIRTDYGPHTAEFTNRPIDRSVTETLGKKPTIPSYAASSFNEMASHDKEASFRISQIRRTKPSLICYAHQFAPLWRSEGLKRANRNRWIKEVASRLISYWFGIAFGRWSSTTRNSMSKIEPSFLICLPERAPAEPTDRAFAIELLVDDPGHPNDIVSRVTSVAEALGSENESLKGT